MGLRPCLGRAEPRGSLPPFREQGELRLGSLDEKNIGINPSICRLFWRDALCRHFNAIHLLLPYRSLFTGGRPLQTGSTGTPLLFLCPSSYTAFCLSAAAFLPLLLDELNSVMGCKLEGKLRGGQAHAFGEGRGLDQRNGFATGESPIPTPALEAESGLLCLHPTPRTPRWTTRLTTETSFAGVGEFRRMNFLPVSSSVLVVQTGKHF